MNAFLFVIAILFFGFILDSLWLVLLGIAGLFLALVAYYVELRKSSLPAPSGGGPRHKLIQAPDNAWEGDEITTYMAAMSGMRPYPTNAPDDHMRTVSRVFERDFKKAPAKALSRDVTRSVLPFPNYGRKTVFEQVFIGLPINIGTLIKKKRIKKKRAGSS